MAAVDITATASGTATATFAGLSLVATMALAASAVGTVDVTMSPLADRTLDLTSRAVGSVNASVVTPSVKVMGLSTRARGDIFGVLSAVVRSVPLAGRASGTLNLGNASLGLASPLGQIAALITGGRSRAAMRSADAAGLTVFDAAREVYNVWGIEITDPRTITFARARVLDHINSAVQLLHSRAHVLDYFNLAEFTVTVTGGTSSKALDDSIQVIRGPVKLADDNAPLNQIMSRGELDSFVAYWYGESEAPSTPVAYFIETRRQAKSDNVALTLHVTPEPVDNTDVTFEAAIEPPRYDEHDIAAATGLQIPHKFAESLLWPILRHFAAGDPNYTGTAEQRQDIATKHQAAMQQLGLYEPRPKEQEPEKAKASA